MPATITAEVHAVVYHNPDNGYAVVRVRAKDEPGMLTVVGCLGQLSPGEYLEITGEWKNHPKFGRQMEAITFKQTYPATEHGVVRFLKSSLKGVGEKTAKDLVERFGVAEDADWMAVVLFVRNLVAEMNLFTKTQKCAIQGAVFEQMALKPLDRKSFRQVIAIIQRFLLDNSKVADLRDQLKAERVGANALYAEMSRVVQDIQASSQTRETSLERMGQNTEELIRSGNDKTEVVRRFRGMVTDMVAQATGENTDGLLKRYPKAPARDFDGDGKLDEMDALIAYLQVLGTLVDFSTFKADMSR